MIAEDFHQHDNKEERFVFSVESALFCVLEISFDFYLVVIRIVCIVIGDYNDGVFVEEHQIDGAELTLGVKRIE